MVSVSVDDMFFETALGKFRVRVKRDGILDEIRLRTHYPSKSDRRKAKARRAMSRFKKALKRREWAGL